MYIEGMSNGIIVVLSLSKNDDKETILDHMKTTTTLDLHVHRATTHILYWQTGKQEQEQGHQEK